MQTASVTASRVPYAFLNLAQHHQIVTSELIADPPPRLEDARALIRDHFLGMDGPLVYLLARAAWPRSPRDQYQERYPATSIPILMMHGTRDGNTPFSGAIEVSAALNGSGQQLVALPGAGHSLFNQTRSTDQLDCAAHLVFRSASSESVAESQRWI